MARKLKECVDYLPYAEASHLAKSTGIRSRITWQRRFDQGDLPAGLPRSPDEVYEEFSTWKSFLNGSEVGYLSYEEARKRVRPLAIKSYRAWLKACQEGRIPPGVPRDPQSYYSRRGSWVSYGDFLGTEKPASAKREFVSYDEARKWASALGLNSVTEWRKYVVEHDIPPQFPRAPQVVYKDEFFERGGWRYFLGNDFMSYEEARSFVRQLGFDRWERFRHWASSDQRPRNFPSQPHVYYHSVWVSYPHFLGYDDREISADEKAFETIADLIRKFPQLKSRLRELEDV